jgi:hypothetical protein
MPLPRLLALVLAVAGCTPAGSLPDGGGGGGDLANGGGGGDLAMVDPCTVTDCSNVIDAVVVRLLAQHGLPLTPEDNGVLCRRLAIDLSGIAPTANEIDQQCTGHTAAQIADYFMNKPSGVNAPDGSPPYVFINRRWWADAFQYQTDSNSADTWYPFTLELDALVSDLYSGKIRYDEFTRRALAEPAFARRFGVFNANTDLVQIAAQAFRLFMGREALPSEANDFGNLWRAWKLIYQDEPTSEANYPGCHYLISGTTYANCYHYDLGYASANCAGTLRSSCQSVVLGPAEVVPSQRWTARSPSTSAGGRPAGTAPTSICRRCATRWSPSSSPTATTCASSSARSSPRSCTPRRRRGCPPSRRPIRSGPSARPSRSTARRGSTRSVRRPASSSAAATSASRSRART